MYIYCSTCHVRRPRYYANIYLLRRALHQYGQMVLLKIRCCLTNNYTIGLSFHAGYWYVCFHDIIMISFFQPSEKMPTLANASHLSKAFKCAGVFTHGKDFMVMGSSCTKLHIGHRYQCCCSKLKNQFRKFSKLFETSLDTIKNLSKLVQEQFRNSLENEQEFRTATLNVLNNHCD